MTFDAMSALFRAHGRRNRKSGLLILLISAGLWTVIAANTRLALSGASPMAVHGQTWPWLTTFLLISALVIPLIIFASAQRCHDIGLPGWLVILAVIPWLGLGLLALLWLIPGTRGDNRYGPDPSLREPNWRDYDMERGP